MGKGGGRRHYGYHQTFTTDQSGPKNLKKKKDPRNLPVVKTLQCSLDLTSAYYEIFYSQKVIVEKSPRVFGRYTVINNLSPAESNAINSNPCDAQNNYFNIRKIADSGRRLHDRRGTEDVGRETLPCASCRSVISTAADFRV